MQVEKMIEKNTIPNKTEIKKRYESYIPAFNEILDNVESLLKKKISISSNPTYKARIKSFSSYYKKILRQKSAEAGKSSALVTLTDMIGIRVICPFVEDLAVVENQLKENFEIKEIERKGAEQSFREFGYESVHILIAIPPECLPQKNISPALPENLVCEIQVRTILQDAWAEVEHELIYKSEFNPFDKPLRRKLASINASLTLADIIFQEIRDYQKRLQEELGTRRNTFYEKADEFSEKQLGNSGAAERNQEVHVIESPYTKGSIDDLVLAALHAHNTGKFDRAIEIYTEIVNSATKPSDIVLGVIYKHRGMAYFAENLYDEALSDFRESSRRDPKSFRSIYYEGIVQSVKNNDSAAIECFNRSLEIDSFQSHVYYRRALAFYNLGEYAKAMEDVNSAVNLGMDDGDVKELKSKLVKKFDMGM